MLNSQCHRWGERTPRLWSGLELKELKRQGFHLLYSVSIISYCERWLWSFYHPSNIDSTSHYLTCHEECYCFVSQRRDTYLYSLYASVFKNFGHNTWLQPNLIEILMFHGHRNRSREWRPSRENSCRVCPHFIRLQKNLHIQLQAELTPNHNSAPKQNSTGNRFQCTVHLEVGDCWKRRGSKAQVWPLNFP